MAGREKRVEKESKEKRKTEMSRWMKEGGGAIEDKQRERE